MKGFETNTQLGKKDGRKYYRMKGVEGIVSSKINEGMSARVKNDAAYANTRLNNAEFGAAGSTAGALVRAMSQSWRYILLPFATGKLAKDVRGFMMQDSTNPWGQRGLTGTTWQAPLAQRVSEFSKNDVGEYEDLVLSCKFDSSTGLEMEVSVDNALHNTIAESKGATGVTFILLGGAVKTAKYDTNTQKYTTAENDIVLIDSTSIDFGESDSMLVQNEKYKQTAQQSDMFLGGVVIMLPYKKINGTKYIMQELASFKMLAATAA